MRGLQGAARAVRSALVREGLRSFELRPSSVEILKTPGAFYERLVERCGSAGSRVSLSALYLGTGELEQALASAVEESQRRGAAATVVLDSARARRRAGPQKGASMIRICFATFVSRHAFTLRRDREER